jgi:hypothetical protein
VGVDQIRIDLMELAVYSPPEPGKHRLDRQMRLREVVNRGPIQTCDPVSLLVRAERDNMDVDVWQRLKAANEVG